jgi:type I restriction enzyme, S subunit
MSDGSLPPGWTTTALDCVGRWGSGGTPSRADPLGYGGSIPWVKIGDLSDGPIATAEEFITEHGLNTSSAKLLPPDTLLVAMYGSIGKLGITKSDCATNQAIAFCKPHSGFDLRYLFYLLMAERHRLIKLGQGGTQLNISQTILRAHEVPIAPSAEQPRIVSKIDELFSRIEEGERALKRVQKLVERYRQSVLKAAVTGELTRAWREQRKGQLESGEALLERILKARREAWEKAELDKMTANGTRPANDKWKQKYKGPAQLGSAPRPDLPAGWTWASVEQAGEVRLGRQRAPQHHSGDHMRPYLRVANVYEDRLDLSDVKEMNFTPHEFETYALREGDILLNEGQSPELVGRPAIYRGEVPGGCYQKTLLRFRVHGGIRSDFALLVFRSYLHSGRFRRSASITTSIAHLAAERFVVIEFPVPSEAEQVQIVDLATSKLSVIAHLERELAEQRKAATSLRQSVLAAAFSGILVDQELTVERRVA